MKTLPLAPPLTLLDNARLHLRGKRHKGRRNVLDGGLEGGLGPGVVFTAKFGICFFYQQLIKVLDDKMLKKLC